MDDTQIVTNSDGHEIAYDAIRLAMNGEDYPMSLAGRDAEVCREIVNIGIDSRLQACFIPDRGDTYEVNGGRLECSVSPESLPVLLRRLFEDTQYGEVEDNDADVGHQLAGGILMTLGFNDAGKQVGREAVGL